MFAGPIRIKLCLDGVTSQVVRFQAGSPQVFLSSTWMQPAMSLLAFLPSVSDFDVVKGCSFLKRYAFQTGGICTSV